MMKDKTGRVTFMPLNRLHPKNPTPPSGQDAIPLIEKLRFDPMHLQAFQQVFGKTWVCRDLTIAAAYVKSHGINTITLDGDKVDRKGALTGGYYDVRRSRLEAINSVMTLKSKWTANERRLREVTNTIKSHEQKITSLVGKIHITTNQQSQARSARDTLAEESAVYAKEKERLTTRVERLEGEIRDLETELIGLAAKLEGYTAEMDSPLANGLSAQEEEQIEALGREVEERQKELREFGKTKNEVRPTDARNVVRATNYFL